MTNLTRDQFLQIIEPARVRGEKPELCGENLTETVLSGSIDPAKVTCEALENAASIAL